MSISEWLGLRAGETGLSLDKAEYFKSLDTDGDGSLNPKEFGADCASINPIREYPTPELAVCKLPTPILH